MTNPFRGPITGPKALAIFSSFFVVIIGVNLVLAWQAIATFPGLEVENSYVASQNFDADRAAQEALGWHVAAAVHHGELQVAVTGPDGAPVEVASIAGIFGRATSVRDDQRPAFVFDGTLYRAPVVPAGGGNWNLRLEMTAADGTLFRQRLALIVD
jgi:nitrogen fixation protein FixH